MISIKDLPPPFKITGLKKRRGWIGKPRRPFVDRWWDRMGWPMENDMAENNAMLEWDALRLLCNGVMVARIFADGDVFKGMVPDDILPPEPTHSAAKRAVERHFGVEGKIENDIATDERERLAEIFRNLMRVHGTTFFGKIPIETLVDAFVPFIREREAAAREECADAVHDAIHDAIEEANECNRIKAVAVAAIRALGERADGRKETAVDLGSDEELRLLSGLARARALGEQAECADAVHDENAEKIAAVIDMIENCPDLPSDPASLPRAILRTLRRADGR